MLKEELNYMYTNRHVRAQFVAPEAKQEICESKETNSSEGADTSAVNDGKNSSPFNRIKELRRLARTL